MMVVTSVPNIDADLQSERPRPPDTEPVRGRKAKDKRRDEGHIRLATRAEITRWIGTFYITAGAGISLVRPRIGGQITANAVKCAQAWADLVMADAALRRAVSRMMVTGKYGALFAAHLPILIVAYADQFNPSNADTAEQLAIVISQQGLGGLFGNGNGAPAEEYVTAPEDMVPDFDMGTMAPGGRDPQ